MAFKDLRDFTSRPTLDLPIGGKVYKIAEPDARTGIWVQQLMADGKESVLADEAEEALYRRILGPAWDQMATDDIALSEVQHAGMTTVVWIIYGEEIAERYWLKEIGAGAEGGDGQGEAQTPDSGDSRPASGGAESTTKSPASGSGTRAGRKRPTPARRGATSSSSGS